MSKSNHYQLSNNQLNSQIHSQDAADFRVSSTKRPWPFLTTPTQKSLNQLLAFLNLYQHAKSQCIPLESHQSHIRVPWPDWSHQILTMPIKKIFDQFLIFVNLCQHAKNQFILSVHSSDTANFRVPSPDWPNTFLAMRTHKIFNHLLICVNLCQHVKTQLISFVHS